MRELGALAAGQLQTMKADSVEFVVGANIDPDMVGLFHKSFYLSNYEWSLKSN